jgi:multiple sugar transport system substrate-binding protein
MQEGTFPKDPSDSSAQTPWETPQPTAQQPLETGVEKSSENEPAVLSQHPSQGGSGHNSSHISKKLIKLGIGLFVILTIFLSIITFILPRFMGSTTKEVTLTYWGLWEDENIMRPIIEEFEKENPNIKVNYIKQDPEDYRERLIVRSENGNGPDIFRFHNTWYPMLRGLLTPLPQETIQKSEFESSFYPVAQEDLIKNGIIYGIPLETDTLALFVNTQIFEEASKEQGENIAVPTTWQEFIDAATKLTKRDDKGAIVIGGAGIGTFENVDHAPDIVSLLMAQNGVDMSNITNSTDKITDAIRFYTNFARVENNVWDSTQDSSEIAFAQGKLAMYFGYSWDYFTIKALNPNIQMKIYPVPQLVTDDKVNIASYWAEGVSSRSRHPKEAQKFIKFLAKPQTQEKLFTEASKVRLFGEPYSNKNLADKLNGSEAFVFVDQSNTAVSTPFVSGTEDNGLNEKLNTYLKDAVNAILSNSSEETAIATFLQGYSQVIGQYNGTARD